MRKKLLRKLPKGKKLIPTIVLSIVGIIVIVTMVNLLISEMLPRPDFGEFCDISPEFPRDSGVNPCHEEFKIANDIHNQQIFYWLASLGLVLLIGGLFRETLLIQLMGMGAGAVLVIESAIRNFNNTFPVIIVLGILLGFIIFIGKEKL